MIVLGHDSTGGVEDIDEGGVFRIGGMGFPKEKCERCLRATLHVAIICLTIFNDDYTGSE